MTLHAHSAGMVRRMGRLFSGENDTAIIVAMDHGMAAVPEGLERILLKALQKQPRDRWKTAGAMANALRAFSTPSSS